MGENKFVALLAEVSGIKDESDLQLALGKIQVCCLREEISMDETSSLIGVAVQAGSRSGVLEVAACGK